MLRLVSRYLCTLILAAPVSCGTSDTAESSKKPVPSENSRNSGSGSVQSNVSTAAATEATVTLTGHAGTRKVDVEVAKTAAERSKGLMFREHLPEGTGMLFVFDTETDQTFWMKNTLISLDMIFIRSDLTIAGIVHEAEPLTHERRSVGAASLYVLEVPGGWARSHGIEAGQSVRFEGVEHEPTRLKNE